MLLKPQGGLPEVLSENPTPPTLQERREPMAGVMRLGVNPTSNIGENPLDLDPTSLNPGRIKIASFKVTATSVGVRGTLPKTAEPLPI
jgi:hypothetical protein